MWNKFMNFGASMKFFTQSMLGTSSPSPLVQYSMLIDTTKCTGCRICDVACKLENELPAEERPSGIETRPIIPGLTSTSFTIVKSVPGAKGPVFIKLQCNQCESPACASVCPAKSAITKEYEGGSVTAIDITKCFGCKYCIVACPFHIPQRDPEGKTATKCTFCESRLARGLKPACYEACPMGAIKFGDKEKIRDFAIERAKEIDGYIYGLKEADGSNILTILPTQPGELGLPEVDEKSYTSFATLRRILVERSGIIIFILASVAFVLLIMLMLGVMK